MFSTKNEANLYVSKNLVYLLNRDKKTRKEVCADLDFKYTTFCDWINGRIVPKYSILEKLGSYFNVAPIEFFGDLEEKEKILAANRLGRYAELFLDEHKELDMDIVKDMPDDQVKELLKAGFYFRHKSYEERLAECGGVAQPYKFDWGEPKGREMF